MSWTEKEGVPSVEREALILLFKNLPELAADLLRDALMADVPEFDEARVASAELTEVQPATLRADLVVELRFQNRRTGAVIVEVQLGRDVQKRLTWPVCVACARLELRRPIMLLVIATDPAVRKWAAQPIALGHPGLVLTPCVLGPQEIPVIDDRAMAERLPELAVLSSLAHARDEGRFDILLTALHAAAQIDEDRGAIYTSIIQAAAGQGLREKLEREMNLGKYPEPTELEKRILARGKAEGMAEGKAESMAQAILTILSARGVSVSDDVRQRVLACSDSELLSAWLERAATCARDVDVTASH